MEKVQKTFALILGIVLVVVGVWGFFTDMILGLFGVNAFQSVLHLIAGFFGIYIGTKGEGPGYNLTLGLIGIALGVLGFVPVIDDLLLTLLNINTEITLLHLAIGVVSLSVYYTAKK
ncbi:DUF4383 domain-containing protein [Candidatus Pacearchaeota archaeon]|nr:DUF4383 domain-containing protein [Candidatus Pacearchaeota archaeon]